MLETVYKVAVAVLLAGSLLYVLVHGTRRRLFSQIGFRFIAGGFAFFLFGAVVDLADGMSSGEVIFIILGKSLGYLLGFVLLSVGFLKWLPAQAELAQAREALRASEYRYRRLFESETDAIIVVDCDTLRILDANAAALTLYGYSLPDVRGLTTNELSAEPEATAEFIASRRTGIPLRWHRKRDGSRFPVEISGSYFEESGRKLHVAAIRDVSDRLAVENALGKYQEGLEILVE